MPTKKTTKKNVSLIKKIDWNPIVVNPIIVFAYAALSILALDGTQLGSVGTWTKAVAAGLMALFSFLKNSLVETRKAIKG